jgi:hypothetical protein
MCIPLHQRDPQTRRRLKIANCALIVGMGLIYFFHPSSDTVKIATHALGGLLVGLSIGLNLCALRRSGCNQPQG